MVVTCLLHYSLYTWQFQHKIKMHKLKIPKQWLKKVKGLIILSRGIRGVEKRKSESDYNSHFTSDTFPNWTVCFYWNAKHSSGDKIGSKGAMSELRCWIKNQNCMLRLDSINWGIVTSSDLLWKLFFRKLINLVCKHTDILQIQQFLY